MSVANMNRDGEQVAGNSTMPQGKKPSTMQGSRAGYLGAANSAAIGSDAGYGQVSAGTPGGPTGAGGKNGSVTDSAATSTKGMGGAATLSESGKAMKEGRKPSTMAGTHKGFL